MIKTAIDTDAIGKYIWNELYKLALKKDMTQTIIAKKIGSTPWYVSLMLTWKNSTKNIEKYWKIAEAIQVPRHEFDNIVEDAKRHVLGDLWWQADIDDESAISHLLGSAGNLPEARKEAKWFLEFVRNKYK